MVNSFYLGKVIKNSNLSDKEFDMLKDINTTVGYFGHTDINTLSKLHILGLITFGASGFINLTMLGQQVISSCRYTLQIPNV